MLEDEGNSLFRGVENRSLGTQRHISEDWNPEQFLIKKTSGIQHSISYPMFLTTCDFQNSIPPPALPLNSQVVPRI